MTEQGSGEHPLETSSTARLKVFESSLANQSVVSYPLNLTNVIPQICKPGKQPCAVKAMT
jgi:hypothetical protein